MCQKNTKTIFMETPNINLRLRNFFILSTPLQFLSKQEKKTVLLVLWKREFKSMPHMVMTVSPHNSQEQNI